MKACKLWPPRVALKEGKYVEQRFRVILSRTKNKERCPNQYSRNRKQRAANRTNRRRIDPLFYFLWAPLSMFFEGVKFIRGDVINSLSIENRCLYAPENPKSARIYIAATNTMQWRKGRFCVVQRRLFSYSSSFILGQTKEYFSAQAFKFTTLVEYFFSLFQKQLFESLKRVHFFPFSPSLSLFLRVWVSIYLCPPSIGLFSHRFARRRKISQFLSLPTILSLLEKTNSPGLKIGIDWMKERKSLT